MTNIINFQKIIFFFSIIGPGIISAIAGNDAGGITTFSVAGAHFGYALFWTMIPLIVLLIVVQEMCARMGVVTGKGLSDLIRETFGIKMTVLLMIALFIANFSTTVSEFAGIASAAQILNLNVIAVVLGTGFLILLLIIRVTYKLLEKVFLFMCFFYVTYIISGVLAHPNWKEIGISIITPQLSFEPSYLIILVGLLGTSIAPWMQFYLQSSIVEKGVKLKEYAYTKWELIVGAVIATCISFFILLAAGATLYPHKIIVDSAAHAAVALEPFAGHFASLLFAVGLFAAAFFGAFILPLSTAYYVCEAFGWESGVNKKFNEAKEFYIVICVLLLPSMFLVLLPNAPLISIMIIAQVINGVILPFVLIAILRIINDEKIMGEYVSSQLYTALCWIVIGILIIITWTMVGMTLWQFISKFG